MCSREKCAIDDEKKNIETFLFENNEEQYDRIMIEVGDDFEFKDIIDHLHYLYFRFYPRLLASSPEYLVKCGMPNLQTLINTIYDEPNVVSNECLNNLLNDLVQEADILGDDLETISSRYLILLITQNTTLSNSLSNIYDTYVGSVRYKNEYFYMDFIENEVEDYITNDIDNLMNYCSPSELLMVQGCWFLLHQMFIYFENLIKMYNDVRDMIKIREDVSKGLEERGV